jgi:hypothetical protein
MRLLREEQDRPYKFVHFFTDLTSVIGQGLGGA